MNQRYNKSKIFAFTLAEMMVILLVFSVIAAATLPVVSMRQKLGNVDNNAMSDYPGVDKWSYSQIGSTGQYALSNIGAGVYSTVAIGMEPTAADVPLGTKPQLMINKDENVQDASHITFLGTMGSNVYYNGRLSMAGDNVALGNDASWFGGSDKTKDSYTDLHYGNIAIGTKAMYRDNDSYQTGQKPIVIEGQTYLMTSVLQDSIAIGNFAALHGGSSYAIYIGTYSGNRLYNVYGISIGKYAGYVVREDTTNAFASDNIAIGNYALSNCSFTLFEGFSIGNYSTFCTNSSDTTTPQNNNIGYYAGSSKNASCGIGYFSGYGASSMRGASIGAYAALNKLTGTLYNDRPTINIGYMAGSEDKMNAIYPTHLNIGYMAGRLQNVETCNIINIGYQAGLEQVFNKHYYDGTINIGYLAGAKSALQDEDLYLPINIGKCAGYYQTGYGYNINIGYYAGCSAMESYHTICIGDNACLESAGDHDIRIGKGKTFQINSPHSSNENLLEGLYSIMTKRAIPPVYIKSGLVSRKSYIGYLPKGDLIGSYTVGRSLRITTYYNDPWSPVKADARKFTKTTGRIKPGAPAPNPYSALTTTKSNSAQLLITGGTSDSNFSTSSILLYSTHIYAPTASPSVFSDKRLKENIKHSKYSLKDLRKINIYEYNFKEDKEKSPRIGVIAQELQKIIPQAVTNINDGYLAINAEWINYTVVNSIKELASQIDVIQKEFTSYVKEFVTLVARVNTLEKQIKNLEQENKVLLTSVDKAYRKAKARK